MRGYTTVFLLILSVFFLMQWQYRQNYYWQEKAFQFILFSLIPPFSLDWMVILLKYYNSPEIWISGYRNMSNCSQYKYPWPTLLFRSMVLQICHPRIFLHDRIFYQPPNPSCSEPSYIHQKKGEEFCYGWDNMTKVFYMNVNELFILD